MGGWADRAGFYKSVKKIETSILGTKKILDLIKKFGHKKVTFWKSFLSKFFCPENFF